MAHGEISVWWPSEARRDAYKPGMDLGPPDEVIEPERVHISFTGNIEDKRARQKRAIESRDEGKVKINPKLYKKHRKAGMRDKEIALKYGIKPGTLAHYKSVWRKGEKR